VRNAIHWEAYGTITADDVLIGSPKTLTLAWDIGGTEYLTLEAPIYTSSETNYHLEAHLAIRSTSQIILTLKITYSYSTTAQRIFMASGNFSASLTTNKDID